MINKVKKVGLSSIVLGALYFGGCTGYDEIDPDQPKGYQKNTIEIQTQEPQGTSTIDENISAELKRRQQLIPPIKQIKRHELVTYIKNNKDIKTIMNNIRCYCGCQMKSLMACYKAGMFEGGCSGCIDQTYMLMDMYRGGREGHTISLNDIAATVDKTFKDK